MLQLTPLSQATAPGRPAVPGLRRARALRGLTFAALAFAAAASHGQTSAEQEAAQLLAASDGATTSETVDLLEAYLDAKNNDPVLGQAVASYEATRQQVPQTRAGLLPSITGTARTSWNEQSFPLPPFPDTDPNSPTFGQLRSIPDQNFNEHTWQVELTQPILNMESWFTYTSSKANLRVIF